MLAMIFTKHRLLCGWARAFRRVAQLAFFYGRLRPWDELQAFAFRRRARHGIYPNSLPLNALRSSLSCVESDAIRPISAICRRWAPARRALKSVVIDQTTLLAGFPSYRIVAPLWRPVMRSSSTTSFVHIIAKASRPRLQVRG